VLKWFKEMIVFLWKIRKLKILKYDNVSRKYEHRLRIYIIFF